MRAQPAGSAGGAHGPVLTNRHCEQGSKPSPDTALPTSSGPMGGIASEIAGMVTGGSMAGTGSTSEPMDPSALAEPELGTATDADEDRDQEQS